MSKKNPRQKVERQLKVNKKLLETRNKLQKDLENLKEEYLEKMSSVHEDENFIERLPLESLADLQEFAAGVKTFNLHFFDEKRKMEKKRDSKMEELFKLDYQIDQGGIDLILKKIEVLLEDLKDK